MKKTICVLIIGGVLLSGFLTPVFAKTEKTSATIQELLQSLKEQIEALKIKIAELISQVGELGKEEKREAKQEVKEEAKTAKTTLKLLHYLRRGMTGEDVELLQEILATDPDIYPEGLVTGYFGPLTEKAVKRFQKKANIEQVGVVGPKTTAKINELLEEGAGVSGKVPPGLLVAPGIIKKLGYKPEPLPGQILPPGIAKKIGAATTTPGEEEEEDEEDIIAPVISGVAATSTAATSTEIAWTTDEEADSKVWHGTETPLVISTSTLSVFSSDLVLNHIIALSSLTASTTYYYLVTSADNEGNTATSSEYSFTTLSE